MQNENYLTVEGKRFHYIWLRDHCLCPECRQPSSFQKVILPWEYFVSRWNFPRVKPLYTGK